MKKFFLLALGVLGASLAANAANVSFNECPAVGNDTTGCEFLITVGSTGTLSVAVSSPDLGPYDGSDDTLVGILNSSKNKLYSINLSSSTDIFGFDGDGACTTLGSSCVSPDPNGYGGPGVTYSNINAAQDSGTVNFAGGIAPGGSAWFSLEEALTVSQIVPSGPGTSSAAPEPASLALIGGGFSLLYFVRRKKSTK